MVCPKCANDKTKVPDTKKKGAVTWRLRYCPHCHFSFTTTERPNLTLFTQEEKDEYEEYIAQELTQSQNSTN